MRPRERPPKSEKPGKRTGFPGHRFDNVRAIARVAAPVLLVAGQNDPVCPPANAAALYAAAPSPTRRLEPPVVLPAGHGAGHGASASADLATRVRRFLALALSAP